MPRNPATKKGQHNNRHENGLVGPGKRVTKQKSNGHLNGNAKPIPPPEPNPVVPVLDPQLHQQNFSATASSSLEPKDFTSSDPGQIRLRKRGSESSNDGQEQRWDNANGSISSPVRRLDMGHGKNKTGSDVNALQIASTILRSCPAGDTVALLIVLLALPSMVLTVVQALFAVLTLMPPSGASPVSFLSLFDVFQGSAGSPSFGTMAVVDVICFGLWVCLWSWAQNFALDLAQIQIAITLGSGSPGKHGSVSAVCLTIVLLLHSIRSRGVRRFLLSDLFPSHVLSHPRVTDFTKHLPSESDFGSVPGSPSKFRSLFAIHIISQALMAYVRRRVAGTSTAPRSTKKVDSETYSMGGNALDSQAQDTLFNTAASSGVEYQPPPTPGLKDGKDKLISAKKRRRQANQVRSRQPFWAALASTKVHVLREVEHSRGQPSNVVSQDSPVRTDQSESVWITNVEPATISFEATNLNVPASSSRSTLSDWTPCDVSINGAPWTSLTMDPIVEHEQDDLQVPSWTGTISGLAPDCTYTCTFSRTDDNEVFASIVVRTPAVPENDQTNSIPAIPARQSLRPSSPTSTLKNSIQAADSKREDANNRRNRVRRNHKSSLAKMDREIETWQNKLKSGSDDNKLKQKLLQAERSSRQHEESTSSIAAALDDLKTIPEEETEEYKAKKSDFDERNGQLTKANDGLAAARSEANNDLQCAKNELNTTLARKDRLTTRGTKLTAEHERITQANIQNLSEKERKAVESAAKESDQQRQELEWARRMAEVSNQAKIYHMQNKNFWRDIENFEVNQRETMYRNAGPLTPEGELPGTNSLQARNFMFGGMQPSTFVPDPQASPFLAYAKPLSMDARRPRSNTNQSLGAASGFSIDMDDADPIPPMPGNIDLDNNSGLNGRKSSGSSRGQNNNSPATGVVGSGGLRSPQRGSHSPGQIPSTSTW